MMQLTDILRDKLAAFVPIGYNASDLRVATVAVQVQPLDVADPETALVLAKVQKAGPPMTMQGKPTVMRMVSWIGHAGVPNRNRDAFVAEELQAMAPTLFRAPNFGVMDFNHSAVRTFSDDPKVIGVWHKAEWAFDKKANYGKGAWGVLATGMAFAWLFPEIADKLLADQTRSGSMKVSWTWIPSSQEMVQDAQGESYAISHNPVFFTVSMLDVPPADPDAQGIGTEDPTVQEEDLRSQVAVAERVAFLASRTTTEHGMWLNTTMTASVGPGGTMTDAEILAQLRTDKASAEQKIADLTAQFSSKENTAATRIAELEAKVAELDTKIAASETKVAELETAKQAAATELEKAATRIAELEAQVAVFEAAKAEAEKAQAAQEKATRLVARVAGLPENYRTAHAARSAEIRARVEAKWAEMDDDAWKAYVTDELTIASVKVGFVQRSEAERIGAGAGEGEGEDIGARVARLIVKK